MSVERWSIWHANLDPVVGSEQGKKRPVLVISDTALNDILPVINVIPITSRKPAGESIRMKLCSPTAREVSLQIHSSCAIKSGLSTSSGCCVSTAGSTMLRDKKRF